MHAGTEHRVHEDVLVVKLGLKSFQLFRVHNHYAFYGHEIFYNCPILPTLLGTDSFGGTKQKNFNLGAFRGQMS
ncbi:MAG: hypothetical protein RBG13Loki_0671, partial [Promethearchaeota archaeon CR_4]